MKEQYQEPVRCEVFFSRVADMIWNNLDTDLGETVCYLGSGSNTTVSKLAYKKYVFFKTFETHSFKLLIKNTENT